MATTALPSRPRIGIDLTGVHDWTRRLDRTPQLREVAFTPAERRHCADDPAAWAFLWAVKEATGKLLGTGFDGLGWHGIEVHAHAGHLRVVVRCPEAASPSPRLSRQLQPPCSIEAVCSTSLVGLPGVVPDHLLVMVTTAPVAAVATQVLPVPAGIPRGRRAEARSGLSRVAAQRAAATLTGDDAEQLYWSSEPSGVPVAHRPDGSGVEVSLSHGPRWAAAAVHVPGVRLNDSEHVANEAWLLNQYEIRSVALIVTSY